MIEPIEHYPALWEKTKDTLSWHCPFMLPFWLEAVQLHVGADGEPRVLIAVDEKGIIGIVPLVLRDRRAGFMGPHHVCDYQDMIVAPGSAAAVMEAVLEHLRKTGIHTLTLRTLRPDSQVLTALNILADNNQCTLQTTTDEVTYEVSLPLDWDGYLMQLSGKQRHEVRRKIRRLESNGPYDYRVAGNNGMLERDITMFFDLFRSNRQAKAEFLNSAMEAYFTALIRNLAQQRILRLCFLEVRGRPTAAVLCFDYQGVRYLYNSGFDQYYDEFSVGILSKVFSIRSGIESGCRHYDFLKGQETYKGRIGGSQTPLYQCTIEL